MLFNGISKILKAWVSFAALETIKGYLLLMLKLSDLDLMSEFESKEKGEKKNSRKQKKPDLLREKKLSFEKLSYNATIPISFSSFSKAGQATQTLDLGLCRILVWPKQRQVFS